jgi:hypothetical protein
MDSVTLKPQASYRYEYRFEDATGIIYHPDGQEETHTNVSYEEFSSIFAKVCGVPYDPEFDRMLDRE